MAISILYISAIVCFFIVAVLSLVAFIQGSVNDARLLGTPAIPIQKAIVTSFGTATIQARTDELFKVLTRFEEYPRWSSYTNYQWEKATVDVNGVPRVGSRGTLEVRYTKSQYHSFFLQATFMLCGNKTWLYTPPGILSHDANSLFSQLHLEGFAPKIIPIKLSILDSEKRMITERSTGYPSWLLSSERVQEIVPIEGHKDLCEYRSWHTIQGICAYFLLLLVKEELDQAVRETAKNLKVFVEKRKGPALSKTYTI